MQAAILLVLSVVGGIVILSAHPAFADHSPSEDMPALWALFGIELTPAEVQALQALVLAGMQNSDGTPQDIAIVSSAFFGYTGSEPLTEYDRVLISLISRSVVDPPPAVLDGFRGIIINSANVSTYAEHNNVFIVPVRDSDVPGCETMAEGCFRQEGKVMMPGGVVGFNNYGNSIEHTFTSGTPQDGPTGEFDSGVVGARSSYSFGLDAEGTYDYYCRIHPWMTGQFTVGMDAWLAADHASANLRELWDDVFDDQFNLVRRAVDRIDSASGLLTALCGPSQCKAGSGVTIADVTAIQVAEAAANGIVYTADERAELQAELQAYRDWLDVVEATPTGRAQPALAALAEEAARNVDIADIADPRTPVFATLVESAATTQTTTTTESILYCR